MCNLSYFKLLYNVFNWCFWGCFPHIVNLCCKAVLGAITNLKFAEENANDYECSGDVLQNFDETLKQDPIATTCSLIGGVWICLSPSPECDFDKHPQIPSLSLHRQYFSDILKALKQKDLQLLWDVDMQCFSTLLMIERVLLLDDIFKTYYICTFIYELTFCLQAIDQFFEDYVEQCGKNGAYFPELAKFKLVEWGWSALQKFQEILQVCTLIITYWTIND